MYARTRPIQSGCADTPISTKIMPTLSSSERGLRAEMSPIGIAISSQTTAPPITSDIVTGAARPITSSTGCRLRCERRSRRDDVRDEGAVLADDRAAVDPDRLAQRRPLVDPEAATDRLVVARDDEEEDVRVERQGEEEHDRPCEPPEHEAEHRRSA